MRLKHSAWTAVLLSWAACSSPSSRHDPARTAVFTVSNGFSGPVYLIWDPEDGLELQLTQRGVIYPFDSQGVIRIRGSYEWAMPGFQITAFQEDGTQLLVKRKLISGGKDKVLPTSVWIVSREILAAWNYPDELVTAQEQLLARGVTDIEWTPTRRALEASASALTDLESTPATFPLELGPDRPQPRFVIADGYEGAIYLVSDPASSVRPRLQDKWLIFDFPSNGVLRLGIEEQVSAIRSWPLVFERGGRQLWLRPLGRSEGFETLPIQAFLVCRNPDEAPGYPAKYSSPLREQLAARGVTDLDWPTE